MVKDQKEKKIPISLLGSRYDESQKYQKKYHRNMYRISKTFGMI